MKKGEIMKKLLAALALLMVVSGSAMAKSDAMLDVLPLLSSSSEQQNRVWVGTFQLAWNDLMDGIVKGPVIFEGDKSKLAKQLNKQKFKADMLSEDSYYKTYGEISPELKETIEKIVADNPQSVEDYHSGKKKAIGFLVGQTMKATQGKADPGMINQILKEILDK